jgi:membrane-associated protease RseP (regulator of RpoE activity)
MNSTMRSFGLGVLGAWTVGVCVLAISPQRTDDPLPLSTPPLRLLGALANAVEPAKSTCLVQCSYSGQQATTTLLEPGQQACNVAEIAEVREESVVIRNLLTNRLELLTFAESGSPSASPPSTTARQPFAPRVVKSSSLIGVELQRDTVNHYLANLTDLLNCALAIPRYRDTGNGRQGIDGFELSRVKEGSVVEQIGLQDGDVILEVNGSRLDSMESVIRLVGQAQAMTRASMTVLRNGRSMNFVLTTK